MSRIAVLRDVNKNHPTTVRDICKRVDLSPPTVWHHLENLKDEGLVMWDKGKARTIRPTEPRQVSPTR